MPKFAVDGLTVVAALGCIAALAACGSSESRRPRPAAASVQHAGAAQIPGDGAAQADAAAAGQVVTHFIDAFAHGNGDAACDLMTDEAIAGVVDDGEHRAVDEAYQLCTETVKSLREVMDGEDEAALRDAEITGTKVDGDTAHVSVSISGEPIDLERTEDGWMLLNAPTG